jgi:ferric-dicitrate binding protein FerR (iron transport regulator)
MATSPTAISRTTITTESVPAMPANTPLTNEQQAATRRGVRRTLLLFVVIAVAIYVGFILLGMLGGAPK